MRVFLDIGANVGACTISLCRTADWIYAFEASKSTSRSLRENLDRKSVRNVTVISKAVYNEKGLPLQLNHSRHSTGCNSIFSNDVEKSEEVGTLVLDRYVAEK